MEALPAGVSEDIVALRKPDGGIVYLLGTCHVSDTSASDAADLVRRIKPSAVVLELCAQRSGLLEADQDEPETFPPSYVAGSEHTVPEAHSLAGVASDVGSVLSDWTALIKLQYSALDGLTMPRAGGEFRAAAEAAKSVGASVVLADRTVDLTTLRLRRLTPISEVLMTMVFDMDVEWTERQALERHANALALQSSSSALAEAIRSPLDDPTREAKLSAAHAAIAEHAARAVEAAIPGFADAAMIGLIRRFWYKEIIGEAERAKLRVALDGLTRMDPLVAGGMPPTMRRVLLDERDVVLCDALKRQAGPAVVGIVGKAHVRGITELWEHDTASRLPAALETPPPSLVPYAGAAVALVGLPLAARRSRAVRYGLGAATLAIGGGAAWFVTALRDRLDFYQRSQLEQQQASRGCRA